MNNLQNFKDYLLKQQIDFEESVSLKKKTWIKRGGVTNFWVLPNTENKLSSICIYCYKHQIHFEIVGHTSNLYFYNDYHPFIVITTVHLTNYIVHDTEIECEPGTPVAKLANQCIKQGFIGYEGFIGLPGTIASAVYNNSSCFGSYMSDIFIKATFLQEDSHIKDIFLNDLKYTQRSSALKRKELRGVILKVFLKRNQTEHPQQLIDKAIENKKIRNKTQEGPLNNLGSICGTISGYRKSTKNLIVRSLLKIYTIINHPSDYQKHKFTKKLILTIYRRKKLSKYISDYNMNCFIWKDDNADIHFNSYIALMKKVYHMEDDNLEIELKVNQNKVSK